MSTNHALRLQVRRLVNFGITQKVIAAAMGIDPSTLSKWMSGARGTEVSVGAMDGLRRFLSDLQTEATRDVTTLSKEDIGKLEAELEVSKSMRQIRKRRAALTTGKKDRRKGR